MHGPAIKKQKHKHQNLNQEFLLSIPIYMHSSQFFGNKMTLEARKLWLHLTMKVNWTNQILISIQIVSPTLHVFKLNNSYWNVKSTTRGKASPDSWNQAQEKILCNLTKRFIWLDEGNHNLITWDIIPCVPYFSIALT